MSTVPTQPLAGNVLHVGQKVQTKGGGWCAVSGTLQELRPNGIAVVGCGPLHHFYVPAATLELAEPTIDPAEIDAAFPRLDYTDAEWAQMEAEFRAASDPEPFNRSMIARPVTVLSREVGGNMAFLMIEDNLGNKYTTSEVAPLYANVNVGDTGFITLDSNGVWEYRRTLPKAPKPVNEDPADAIPF